MFFILSKLLYFIVSPLIWIILVAISVFLSRNRQKQKRRFVIMLTLLLIFSNPFIINRVMRSWEVKSLRISDLQSTYDIAVLLGGAMRYYNSETERLVYGSSVDRMLASAELYHAGKVRKILISGGSGSMVFREMREAPYLAQALIAAGVSEQDLILENNSRNTHENAIESAAIINEHYPGARVLLVTSAYHMRRSVACFEKQGLQVAAFPTDQHSGLQLYTPDKLLIPGTDNMLTWEKLLHEWLGVVAYKVLGYI